MHALSSDTRVIYIMTISFFDSFDYDFQLNDFDEEDSYYQRAVELREKLSRVSSYTLTDNEFQSLFWDIVHDALEKVKRIDGDKCAIIRTTCSQDAICKSIATHYGWGEVDTRRLGLVREYCSSLVDYLQQSRPNSSS